MKLKIENVLVDSGTIVVSDAKIIEKKDGYMQTFKVENGIYNVVARIKNTWNGNVSTRGIVKVTTKKIVVTDPCYLTKDWEKYARKFFDEEWEIDREKEKKNGFMILDNMGGDGSYIVELTLEKVK